MAQEKEYAITGSSKVAPAHPGEILREDVFPALGMNVSQAAQALHVSRQTLHRILAGTMAISPEMAVRLGKFCGNGPELWLRLQAAYDLWHAEKRLRAEIKSIPTRKAPTHKRAA